MDVYEYQYYSLLEMIHHPPETHPGENGACVLIHTTKNITELTHTHSPLGIMKDIFMIERGGWGIVYCIPTHAI